MTEESLIPGSAEVKTTFSKAMQRHHDYFVGMEREGTLTDEDRPQLELAMQRELDGLVQPLSEKPTAQSDE